MGLAAVSSYSLPDDYGKYTAALAAGLAATGLYLLHYYPAEAVTVAASPPQQAP